MIKSIETLLNLLYSFFQLLGELFGSIMTFFGLVGKAFLFVLGISSRIPLEIQVACMAILGLLLFLNVINKGG